ncbi:efflux RND transporter permease subunit [uncultured Ferrimonas sp.]|uniref:efflux RND transporter permease subunit n=1 Tax=uncultured Ferrimonas sp. TaxID=432640 RepID=UPI00262FDE1D|nr:efflux RND transporter permease subunit [uncultured Ferrimonas sp.]
MTQILSFFAQRLFLARALTIMVLTVGIGALGIVKLQELPNVAFAEVSITTQYPGASAADVELNVTNKIEKELKSVQGVRRFTSESSAGRSQILLELDEGERLDRTVRQIQQAVDRVSDLPTEIDQAPLVEQETTASFEVMSFGVVADVDNAQLQQYSRQLEQQIRALPGISKVEMAGFRQREFWIEVNPEKIRRFGIDFQQINNAIEQRNVATSGGAIESFQSERQLVTLTQFSSIKQLQQTIIEVQANGTIVRLRDVAKVHDTFERAQQLGMINGSNAILFTVYKSASADINATIDGVKSLLQQAEVRSQHTYQFPVSLDLAQDMSERFNIVSTNGGIGLMLVLLLLSVVLQRRVAFWVALSIPFCLLGVIALLPAFNMNLDSVTLAALLLVIGVIVDDSIIVAESVYQQHERGLPPLQAAVTGTKQVLTPVLASLTTTALVFVPMLFIPGTLGKAIAVIPVAVILALLWSLFECTVTLPAHLHQSLAAAPRNRHQPSPRWQALSDRYQQLLGWCLQRRKRTLASAAVALLLMLGSVAVLKIDFFPGQAAKYIEIHTETAPGLPLAQVRQAHLRLEQAIAALPSNELASYQLSYAAPISSGLIRLTSAQQRQRTAVAIAASLEQELADLPQLKQVKFVVDAGGPPPGEPVELRVISNDSNARQQAVAQITQWMAQQPPLYNINNSDAVLTPQLQILPRYEWLARYQLTVADLATTLRIAFDGEQVSQTWINDQEITLRVLLSQPWRNAEQLTQLKLTNASGIEVPLTQLAHIKMIDAPRTLLHFNGVRQVLISAQVNSEDVEADELAEQMLLQLAPTLPPHVTLELGGEIENTNEALSGFFVAFPAAMLAIFFVMAILFESMLQPLLVMAVIPFAVGAALLALLLHLQPLSLFALIGVLGMTGVVVNNALVLINQINQYRQQGQAAIDAITAAASSRLRPILLTSASTVIGLLPLAYGFGGTDVYMGPMALTLGYGLLLSLPVVLLVLPVLYASCVARR